MHFQGWGAKLELEPCTNVSPPLLQEVGQNDEITSPRGPTIRSPPIVWTTKHELKFNQLTSKNVVTCSGKCSVLCRNA